MIERPKPNRVLANSDLLIKILARQGAMSPAEIAEQINVARSSVYRLIEGLNAVGWTETLPDSSVGLGKRWLRLADLALQGMPEWADAQKHLDAIAEATGQTAFLTIPRFDEAVCIAWAQGRGIDLLVLKPGRTLPLHAGAAGRSMLANMPRRIPEVLSHAPFHQLTRNTLVTEDQLLADIEVSRGQGYTLSDEDVTIGISAVGVAIKVHGELVGCVSLGGISDAIRTNAESFAAVLKSTASMMEDRIASRLI